MDMAVGNDLGAGVDHGQHHQVAAAGVNLLARTQGFVNDQRAQRRFRRHRHGCGGCGLYRGCGLGGVGSMGGRGKAVCLVQRGRVADRHAGVGRGHQTGGQACCQLAGIGALDGNRHHAELPEQVHQGRKVDGVRLGSLAAGGGIERRQVNHQRVMVKEVGNVAEAGAELTRQQ